MKTLNKLLEQRYSPRSFADQPVSKATLQQLFEAARRAPSSFNEQPWRFVYATQDQPQAYERLLSCINESNQQWAQQSPVLILSLAKSHFSRNEKPNRHAWHDVGTAIGFLILKATELDLFVHQMAGFYPEKARDILGIPDEYEPVAMMAVGYRGDAERSHKPRKAVAEIAYAESWPNP